MSLVDIRFEIEKSLVDLADKCPGGHPCLDGKESLHCRVSFSVEKGEDEYIFIKCPEGGGCSYRLSFGQTHVCTCPVRMQIYRKYGI